MAGRRLHGVRQGLVGLYAPGRLPPVHDRQAHVHQDNVGFLATRKRDPLFSIYGENNVKAGLTKSAIDNLPVLEKDTVYWDASLPGFGVKVTPRGRKVFLVMYRVAGAGSRLRKYTNIDILLGSRC